MALVCRTCGKECNGCGDCKPEKPPVCEVCGDIIEDTEAYFDFLHQLLCLSCLKELHKL